MQRQRKNLHTQVYLHNNGSVNDTVFELSCPASGDTAGLLPVFLAQMPMQSSQPGQSHAAVLTAIWSPLNCDGDLQQGLSTVLQLCSFQAPACYFPVLCKHAGSANSATLSTSICHAGSGPAHTFMADGTISFGR